MSMYRDAIENCVDDLIRKDPQFGMFLEQMRQNLKMGQFREREVKFVGDKWYKPAFDIYDTYCFAHYRTQVSMGALACGLVRLPIKPFADKQIKEMNAALKSLSAPFSGEFWGGTHDSDGSIAWSEPIRMRRVDCKVDPDVDPTHVCNITEILVPPGSVSLEVGYTKPERTYFHLGTASLGLARWVYGMEDISLAVNLKYFDWKPAT